jgi:DNA-binding MarR family transcriptional regulator
MSGRGPVPPPAGDTPKMAPEEARQIMRAFLTEEEERLWFALMDTYDAVMHALDSRLVAEHQLSLSTFEALMHIAHADDGHISISELAQRIRISPSQVSRIAIDLERRGLVQRQRGANDSRSTEVAITDAGRAQLQQAAPTYLSTVRNQIFDALTDRDVKQLTKIWQRIEAGSLTDTAAPARSGRGSRSFP